MQFSFDNCSVDYFNVPNAFLVDIFINTGLLYELNRTMLHPLGISMEIDDEGNIHVFKTDAPEGFLMDCLDREMSAKFGKYRANVLSKRQDKLGFLIQSRDMINSDMCEAVTELSPQQVLFNLITKATSNLNNALLSEAAAMLNASDFSTKESVDGFISNQETLEGLLQSFVENKSWTQVAFISMLLHNHIKIQNALEDIITSITEREKDVEGEYII